MTLPVVIPNEFANATASIPLSQLDSNFSTLANVVNEINAGTQQLANANVAILIVNAGTSAAPTITTTGDTNTGIFFPAADTIAFAEGGAEAMRIDSSGNVGIGISSPTSLMHIASATANLAAFKTTRLVVPAGATTTLGEVVAGAYSTGTTIVDSARISFFSDAIWSPTSTPSSIRFETTSSGSTTYTERMRIDSGGNVGIGTGSPTAIGSNVTTLHVSGTGGGGIRFERTSATASSGYLIASNGAVILSAIDAVPLAFRTTNTERMRITSSGEVLVGGTTEALAISGVSLDSGLSVQSTGGASIKIFRNDTSILSGNVMGSVAWYGNDTTSDTPTGLAYIAAIASGTHDPGDNPTDLVFGTTPNGSATVAEKMRLTEAGYLRLASGTGGIQFGGDTAAANALDDYEEGTWTPVIADASTGGNASVTTPTSATYTKIGNLVNVQCFFTDVSTVGLTAGNDIFIRGFPFTALSVSGTTFVPGSIIAQQITFSGYLTPYITDNNTFGRIAENTTGAVADFIIVSEFSSGATDFYMSLTYQAA